MTVDPTRRRPGRAARAVLAVIGFYQSVPRRREGSCRYVPTCSSYAAAAVSHHGAARGGWLALRRLLRCNPLGSFGYDPVPGVADAHGQGATRETDPPTPTDRPSVSASSTPRAA